VTDLSINYPTIRPVHVNTPDAPAGGKWFPEEPFEMIIGDAAKAATIKIPVNGEFSEAAVAHARQITGTAP
jgi:hypothetical protein